MGVVTVSNEKVFERSILYIYYINYIMRIIRNLSTLG